MNRAGKFRCRISATKRTSPYSAADEDEDDLYEEEAAPRPASAEEDPYGLDNAYFDPYEQIFFSQISDDLYQIASPTTTARG